MRIFLFTSLAWGLILAYFIILARATNGAKSWSDPRIGVLLFLIGLLMLGVILVGIVEYGVGW